MKINCPIPEVGLDSSNDFLCTTASLPSRCSGTGSKGVAPGAIIGGIVGSAKVKIPIKGNYENYKNQKKDIEHFRYLY
jgi:hypothetical protein